MDQFEKYYNRVLRFLSYRPRSKKEIEGFLKRKKVDPSTVKKIFKKLKELNLVNDKEFAKWWVEQRMEFKPRGVRLLKIELRQKGIDEETIEFQISSASWRIKNQKFDELEMAKKLLGKKLPRYRGLPKAEAYRKLGQFLARRGFDWETIKTAVDEALEK